MFKKVEESLNMLSKSMEDILKIQIKLLETKTTVSETKKLYEWDDY